MIVALVAVAAGIVLVRLGWSGRRMVAAVGWVLAVAGLVMATAQDGAWGCAVATVAGIGVALAAVLLAGWRSTARARRPARIAASPAALRQKFDIARRVTVFALVVPGAFIAAQWLAWSLAAFTRARGVEPADTIVLTLLAQPLAWAALMTVQMTRSGPVEMVAPLVAAALLGAALWDMS